jgi:hypothetical protein
LSRPQNRWSAGRQKCRGRGQRDEPPTPVTHDCWPQ